MKSRHQESNLAVPHTEEKSALCGENEDTQMNGAPNENVPLTIGDSYCATTSILLSGQLKQL
jgi:hypothetical protein